MSDIYNKVLEALVREFNGAGAVGGFSTPLGTGPKAGSGPGSVYNSSNATDKKHRSKGSKKKTETKSVQYYLKNGNKKRLKETYLRLFEARSARVKDLSKPEIIAFLNYLKGEVDENMQFSTTEKIAGQAMTVGIKGTAKGNEVYCAIKDRLIAKNNNIFDSSFLRSKGTSGLVKTAFIKNFRKLNAGEEIILNMEIVINDKRKPDYIAYEVPYGTEYAAIFSINPVGSFTKEDAKKLSGEYYNRRRKKTYTLKVLLPEDIPLTPNVDVDNAIKEEIDDLILTVRNLRHSKKLGPDFPVKADINREIAPRIRSLVKSIFPSSNINARSPIEGIAVNLTSGEDNKFFKVPNADFDKLQSIQASVYAEFKTNRYGTSMSRAQGFIEQLNNPKTSQSFARNVFKLIDYLNDVEVLPLNYRTFFSPDSFKQMCDLMLQGLQQQDMNKIANSLDLISKRLYTSKGFESFKSQESESLTQFIRQNNLI